jgi:hypothetical protein
MTGMTTLPWVRLCRFAASPCAWLSEACPGWASTADRASHEPLPAAHTWAAVYARLHNPDRAAAAEVRRAPLRAWPLAWPSPSGPPGWQRSPGALDAGGASPDNAFRPRACGPFARRLVHLARDDPPGSSPGAAHARCVTAGARCGGVWGIGAAGSGPRRCACRTIYTTRWDVTARHRPVRVREPRVVAGIEAERVGGALTGPVVLAACCQDPARRGVGRPQLPIDARSK